ncbi:MAG TPA: glycosyl hydrolase, partial [Opitutaceae bacterium]
MPLRYSALPAVLAACAALSVSPAAPAADALVDGFSAPPDSARPLTWWHWINGNVTKDGIKADLTAMKEAGIAGVQLFDAGIYLPAGPVRYGTDDWHEHVQFAIET